MIARKPAGLDADGPLPGRSRATPFRAMHVHAGDLYGAIERGLRQVAEESRGTWYDAEFALCFEGELSEDLRRVGAMVHMEGEAHVWNAVQVRRARKALACCLTERRFDVVVCHSAWALAVFGPPIAASGIPLVFHAHDVARPDEWLDRLGARAKIDLLVSSSRVVEETFAGMFAGAPRLVVQTADAIEGAGDLGDPRGRTLKLGEAFATVARLGEGAPSSARALTHGHSRAHAATGSELPPYLIVTTDFVETGGQDRANLALARHVARLGHPTHLVGFRVAPELAAEPNVVVHVPAHVTDRHTVRAPFLGAAGMMEASRLGPRTRVVVNGGNCFASGAINWVHYVHAADPTPRTTPIQRAQKAIARRTERIALSRARLVIANSERTKRDLETYLGVDPAKVRVIYLGVDSASFHPRKPSERAAIRASLGWAEGRPKAVFVGALGDERKGMTTLFESWRRLVADRAWDGDLVVVGAGAKLDEWRARAQSENLGERVTFLGFRDDVPRIVSACDLLVSPTRYEPYGLGVHEALACGVPALVSASAGVAEMYPSTLRDWLIPDPTDAVDLAARIRRTRAGEYSRDALAALAVKLSARDWDLVGADIAAACEAALEA